MHGVEHSRPSEPQRFDVIRAPSPFHSIQDGRSHLRIAASGGGHADENGGEGGTATMTKPKSITKTPKLYRVMLMNDDFTPMDFVIHVLQKFFQKTIEESTQIMLQVHHQGAGLCGVFSFEIAETKVYQVNQYARQSRHPLKCVMESA